MKTSSQHVERELLPGEVVTWAGRPGQGVRLQSSDALLIPFSLLWAGFAVVWESNALSMGAPGFFALWGIPFVLLGAYMSVGRFFVDSYLRSRSHYFLTDQRALIIVSWPIRRVRSVHLAGLAEVQLITGRNGVGTLIFGSRIMASRESPRSPRFEWIDDVQNVYRLTMELQSDLWRKLA